MNLLVSGAALLLASVIFFAYDLVTFRQGIVQNLSTQAQIIGSNSISALTFNDPQAAESTLSALRAAPNVMSAVIYAADGQPFAAYWRDRTGDLPAQSAIPSGQAQAASLSNQQITIVRRIVFQGTPIGTVFIQSDLQEMYGRLKRYGAIVGFVLVASLIAALLLSRMSQKTISKPIVGLAEVARVVSRDRNYSVRATQAGQSGEIAALIDAFNEMLAQIQERDGALQKARDELELRVQIRTRELEASNGELEAFCYSVSHDLRAPLRGIDGFSQALLEDYSGQLDSVGKDYLERVRAATRRMAQLIDDLLALSRITRADIQHGPIDLSQLAHAVAAELRRSEPGRNVSVQIEPGLRAEGDSPLIRTVLENLIGNAWKFTSKRESARIEVGQTRVDGKLAFFVRDNGAGFDQAYTDRLFGAFQRLHAATEFPGTGIGLASVLRIIHRHGGRIWAEGEVNQGATFYFSLPADPTAPIEEEEHGQQGHLVGRR